ncbi:3-deoxy-D-manno-octulosonic acid transferase [hydrothermal vent metagenome]|uniref:3-deoxy-D-manno-octulosonic acid transferase n=1 Tax=hydrothermal vent metagenome TaxID=652676 RepID=A0A3B1BY26_9ZZZZ
MAYLIYNLVLTIGVIVLSPVIAWRMITRKSARAGVWQKLGAYPKKPCAGRTIWIHAVSVGETLAVERLIRELARRGRGSELVLSVTTATGHAVAMEKLSDVASILYFPYDFIFSAQRAVRAINPALFVAVETEIWPNVFRVVKESGGRVALVNGRISDRSYPRYLRLKSLFRPVLQYVDMFLMQGDVDAERVIEMGAEPEKVEKTGTLKYDNVVKGATRAERENMRKSLGIGLDEKVIFLGNIHEGEEAAIRGAMRAGEKGGRCRIVVAPRRIENIEWIENAARACGLKPVRKTTLRKNGVLPENAIPVIDTFGDLAMLYAIADVAFVGGSLIGHGGQNPLEPAAHAIAPLFGTFMSNFRDVSKELLNEGGAFEVAGEDDICELICDLLASGDKRLEAGRRALDVIERNRGVTIRVADRLLSALGEREE